MSQWKTPGLALLAIILCAATIWVALPTRHEAQKTQTEAIQALITKISAEPMDIQALSQGRQKYSLQLDRQICNIPVSDIDDEEVDILIPYVNKFSPGQGKGEDQDTAVRAAEALAFMGPAAHRAVPAIEDAIKKAQAFEASLGAMTGIRTSDLFGTVLNALSSGQLREHCKDMFNAENLIKKIADATTQQESQRAAEALDMLFCNSDPSDITEGQIDMLIPLLHDSTDYKVRDAAYALAYIGPRAKRAIPEMEEALKRAPSSQADNHNSLQSYLWATLAELKGEKPSFCGRRVQ